MCAGFAARSHAQIAVIGGQSGPELSPPPILVRPENPFPSGAGRDYAALPLFGWLTYPTLFAGGIYDSNVNQTSISTPAGGVRLIPSLLAEYNDGIKKSTLYGMVDASLYPGTDVINGNTTIARGGAIQTYEALKDLVFRFQGDFTRQTDLFSTLGVDHSVTTLNPTGVGLSPVANPQSYNQFTGLASMQRTFQGAFVTVSGSVVDINFDPLAGNQQSPNGAVYTAAAKGGIWMSPFFYLSTNISVDDRQYALSALDSHGVRALAGIGTDQIGLFRGEVYGGYQTEQYDATTLGTVSTPEVGGVLYYYPTPALTLKASADETIGVSILTPTAGLPFGTATKVVTSVLQASYAIDPAWSASGRGGYIRTNYVDDTRIDDAWMVGCTLTYSVWQNFGLAFDYQYTQLISNAPLQSFTRSVVTLGGTYRY
jgi:hypothetical protein